MRALRGRQTAVVAGLVALGLALSAASAPATGGEDDPPPEPKVRRLLVLSLPHVTWEAYEEADTPTLDGLLEDGSIGALAVRVVRRKTETGTGYATIGAGTRAVGPPESGHALGPDEIFEGEPALDVYRRRMGHGSSADVLMLSMPSYVARQARELFDAEVGALGDALDEAGVHRGVIANADRRVEDTAEEFYDRQAAAALVDPEGRVPGGRVDRGLLVADPTAPFGLRLDPDAVEKSFVAEWKGRAVVLVEASDLVRTEAYRPFVRKSVRDEMSRTALESADALAARLLEHVDLERDGVLVVAPASPTGEPQLTIVGLRRPGGKPSLLGSSTTRRDGFVTLYDVGAGIANLMGAQRPDSMEGRPFEEGRTSGSFGERKTLLIRENAEAVFRDDAVGVMSGLFIILQLLLCLGAWLVLHFSRMRSIRGIVGAAALGVLALLPATYLAGAVNFAGPGFAAYLPFVFGVAALLAAVAWVVGRSDPVASAGWLLVVVVGVIVGTTVVSDTELLFNTAFGDSPIIAGRFAGINNLTFAQLAAGGIALSVLLAHRIGGRRGALAASGLLAFLLVVDGLPAWGADVGGVLTAVPAFAYVGYRLYGSTMRLRTILLIGAGTLVVIGAFTAFDLSQPEGDRTHLGRLYEQVDAQGGGAFVTVILRKLAANLRVITSSIWLLMVPGALSFIAYLFWRRPRFIQVVESRVPTFGIVLGGLLVVGVLGFALNDSGIAVPGMVLGVLNPVLVHMAMRFQE